MIDRDACPDCGADILFLPDGTWTCSDCAAEETDIDGDPFFQYATGYVEDEE